MMINGSITDDGDDHGGQNLLTKEKMTHVNTNSSTLSKSKMAHVCFIEL